MKSNKDFVRVQRLIQRVLPTLGLLIIIGVYLITAIAMGAFLNMRMDSPTLLSAVIAYGTGFGSQFTRGYIVFNNQLNPNYLKFGFDGSIFFAFVLAVYTGYEAFHLVPDYFVSIIGLIGSGFIVEFLYLKALNRANRIEIIGNPAERKKIETFFKAENDLEKFIDSLEDEENHPLGAPQSQGQTNGVLH